MHAHGSPAVPSLRSGSPLLWVRLFAGAVSLAALLWVRIPPADGANPFAVIATISVSGGPLDAVAVNPITNRIYAATFGHAPIAVIDGTTNAIVATIPVNGFAAGMDINTATSRLYVASHQVAPASGTVSVIDAATSAVTATIPVGTDPTGVAVNAVTNRVYVTNSGSDTVSVIDGATNAVVATIPAGHLPSDVKVNPTTNRIYVATFKSFQEGSDVMVIDGATNAVVATIPGGPGDIQHSALGVDPPTNHLYIGDSLLFGHGSLAVVDGATNAVIGRVQVGFAPWGVAVNPTAGRVYVTHFKSNTISVLDAGTNAVLATLPAGTEPYGAAVNPVTNRLYVANRYDGSISVIAATTP